MIKPSTAGARFLLPELIDQLESLVRFLRSLTDDDTTFEVVSMQSGSLTAVFRPTKRTRVKSQGRKGPRQYSYRRMSGVTRRTASTLHAITHSEKLPSYADAYSLVQLREFTDDLQRSGHEAKLFAGEESFDVNEGLKRHIESTLGESRLAYTSFTGTLEALNVHGRKWAFTIFPAAGPKRIACRFKHEDLDAVRGLIKETVTVRGVAEYRGQSVFPVKIVVDTITRRIPAPDGIWADLSTILEEHWRMASDSDRSLIESEVASA